MAPPSVTSANPGNVVVPLSAIIDQLQGKLSAVDLNALLLAVVGPKTDEVHPGDLITAQHFNVLRADVRALQIAVAALQGGVVTTSKGPVLVSRDPTGDVEVGSKLTLLGANFKVAGSTNTVMLGNVAVSAFLAEDDTHLAFQVPDLFTGLPRDMTVFVTNANGVSQTLIVRVLPQVPVQGGQVVLVDQTSALGQINVGTAYQLKWLVDSQTLMPVTYKWSLVVSNLDGSSADGWSKPAVFTPAGPTAIAAGAPVLVTAAVTVPAGAKKADVALKVETLNGTFSKTSNAQHFEVGQTAVVSDPRALVTLKAIPPLNPDKPTERNPVRAQTITMPDGTTVSGVQATFGGTGKIPINVHVTGDQTAAGSYAYRRRSRHEELVGRADGLAAVRWSDGQQRCACHRYGDEHRCEPVNGDYIPGRQSLTHAGGSRRARLRVVHANTYTGCRVLSTQSGRFCYGTQRHDLFRRFRLRDRIPDDRWLHGHRRRRGHYQ